jgi:predicted nucleotidyltransferase
MKNELNPIERVYLTFYNSKKKTMYFNEIREKAKMSISSLQNVLLKMDKSKEITKNKEKSNTFYSLKSKERQYLNFTKFDIQKSNSLNINIQIPIKEFLDKINNISFVLLFGSASRGEEKKESDMDLLIVMNHFEDKQLNQLYQKEIKEKIEQIKRKVNAKSLHPISIVLIDEKEFKERKDYLLEEAKKTGFCIYNHEIYYQETLKNEN